MGMLWESSCPVRWKRVARGFQALAAVGLMATMFAVAGCKDKSQSDTSGTGGGAGGTSTSSTPSTGDIMIGEYASLTGGTATFGTSSHNGAQLAIDEVNAAGGINGRKLKLVTEDDQSKPEVASTVVTKLITQDKVVAVLGEVASTRSLAAAPVCQQNKVPMISPSSTNPKVTQVGDFIFRVCFTDDFQAAVAAKFAFDQGYKSVAVFKDIKNDYSVAFAQVFSDKFKSFGGQIAGEQTYQEGDTDFKAQLTSLKALNPNAILVPGYYTEVGTIARQAREVGLNVPLVGGDGWDSPQLVPGAGTALEGCFFTDHYFSTQLKEPVIQDFIKAYKGKYNADPDALCALAYDAAKILIDAMKRAKAIDGPGIRDALADTKDFQGVTGKITIDANRNARKEALVLQIKGKDFTVFKSYTPEQVGL